MNTIDCLVIGGGSAGLAAAISAKENGIDQILVLEKESEAGGILQQCIHNGFGLHTFKEELAGPEYAHRYIVKANELHIDVRVETTVLSVSEDKVVRYSNAKEGIVSVKAKSIILATGCRERTAGNILMPSKRPTGVWTAGTAQKYVNIDGYMVGKRVLILGSGDIGLIMARRMTLEGAKVEAVVEVLPYAAGLTRNVVQCLEDFDIPLYLQSTVIEIHGKERLEAVTIAQVDDKWNPIAGTERKIECDTLLLSVGLVPENELSSQAGVVVDPVTNGPIVNQYMETNLPGIFACGNVLHVHDLVDNVSKESERAGMYAGRYALGKTSEVPRKIKVRAGDNIRYVVPHEVSTTEPVEFFMRVQRPDDNVSLDVGGLRKIRKQSVRPSEMLDVKITPEQLQSLEGDTLTIQIVSQKEA